MYSKLPPGYITKSSIVCIGGGLVAYTGIEYFSGSETFYRKGLMPAVHRFVEPEQSHKIAVKMAKWGLMPKFGYNLKEYPELKTEVLGRTVENPIGLAAGFDKNGEAIYQLATSSGFGMVEIGSVTPLPQPGNQRPRVFRLLEDEGVVNRYGFNSDGVGKVQQRVKEAWEKLVEKRKEAENSNRRNMAIFGVNLGKNKLAEDAKLDYEIGVNYFAKYCDYLVVNISSPNTPGLRSLQSKKELQNLMQYIKHDVDRHGLSPSPKLVLKIAPDLIDSEISDIAQVALDKKYGIDALIISNTTISRPESLKSDLKNEVGGLSGQPLKDLSTECIRRMYRLTKGQVPIIGCGGVANGEDAYAKIRAGASAVQLYTALVYDGFPVVGKVKRELAELIRKDGYSNISEVVGSDHKDLKK
ncbi:hypothetical protein WR25_19443 isoform A [Diploscapter pachys]|uniref:Dihydroorotate dehydrogenase (quinone), mitochondrial n=1 Tax=Diploscapter pachys TaxID=2018661 RepID=A0A2A2JWR7_9BILA|nr:hypothetical protein WR25_19443 isoform A [Diploscapter pachys]